MGKEEKQAQDELREAEQGLALLLRQEHHPQDVGEALRVPLCVRPAELAGVHPRGTARHPGRPAGHGGLRPAGPRAEPARPAWDFECGHATDCSRDPERRDRTRPGESPRSSGLISPETAAFHPKQRGFSLLKPADRNTLFMMLLH